EETKKAEEAKKAEETKSAPDARTEETKSTPDAKKDEKQAAKTEGLTAKMAVPLESFFAQQTKLDKGVYLIDISGLYLNPIDGLTADGGTKNAGIGEGMVDGVVTPSGKGFSKGATMPTMETSSEEKYTKALLQKMSDGSLYATVRLHLMNFITRDEKNGPFIRLLQKDGSFKQIEAEVTAEHIETYEDSYVDYRFPVENAHFLAQIEMFVEPMARPVTFFVESHPQRIEKGSGEFAVKEDKAGFPVIPVAAAGVGVLIIAVGAVLLLKKTKNKGNGVSHE
ncbi:MAG: hypothetical protein Q4D52_00005, partial [Eubacteriales bacterium]|nr:hypothetical protein [Eubacteriales bacterium]